MDGSHGGPSDGPIASNARRISLGIPAAKVQEDLTNFPVYLDLMDDDLKTRLDAASLSMSFRQRNGAAVTNLDYEIQSFDQVAGRLRAWVRLPTISAAAETTFELQYGDAAVKVLPNPAGVWSNGYKAVFHLEQEPAGAMSIVNSVGANAGTPTGLAAANLDNAQLGKGINFDGTGQIAFTNPITGSGPSTISAWVMQRATTSADAVVTLGNPKTRDARWFYSRYLSDTIAVGLYADDWADPGVPIINTGWNLLHWTYKAGDSSLYRNGVVINGSPFKHNNTADTKGTDARIGNAKSPEFGTNMGINGVVDEVHISDVDRSAGWINAEYQNQRMPTTFVEASAPSMLP